MFKLVDRIKEKSYTTGTGNFVLAGPPNSYSSFSSSYSDGDSFYYCITDGTNYEIGTGTFSGGQLVRNPRVSTNSNALVNFGAGLKEVFVTYPAFDAVVANIVGASGNLPFWNSDNELSSTNIKYDGGLEIPGDISVSGSAHFNSITLNQINFEGGSQTSPFETNQLADNNLLYVSGVSNQIIGVNTQPSGYIFAGNGVGNQPIFRPLVKNDIPDIDSDQVNYSPVNSYHWDNIPTTSEQALDNLALYINENIVDYADNLTFKITEVSSSSDLSTLHVGRYVRFLQNTNIDLNLPAQSSVEWPNDAEIIIEQGGEGQITLVPASGVTVHSTRTLQTWKRYSQVTLKRIGPNEWIFGGERSEGYLVGQADLVYDIDDKLTQINYDNSTSKLFSYTGDKLTSIIHSGVLDTVTTTFNYDGDDLVSINYTYES